MVIHDCRNPTNQIKFAIDMALTTIQNVDKKTRDLEGILLQMTDSVLTDFKNLVLDLIQENKELQNQVHELQTVIKESPIFNESEKLMKRIKQLETENKALKEEISNC